MDVENQQVQGISYYKIPQDKLIDWLGIETLTENQFTADGDLKHADIVSACDGNLQNHIETLQADVRHMTELCQTFTQENTEIKEKNEELKQQVCNQKKEAALWKERFSVCNEQLQIAQSLANQINHTGSSPDILERIFHLEQGYYDLTNVYNALKSKFENFQENDSGGSFSFHNEQDQNDQLDLEDEDEPNDFDDENFAEDEVNEPIIISTEKTPSRSNFFNFLSRQFAVN
ncbi:MAG: hypothetical protein AAGI66_07370 [Cyanobacteria bacterium P01_H01_bin.74]